MTEKKVPLFVLEVLRFVYAKLSAFNLFCKANNHRWTRVISSSEQKLWWRQELKRPSNSVQKPVILILTCQSTLVKALID